VTPNVIFSSGARGDLSQLFEYIAKQSGSVRAFNYTEQIRAFCLGLATFPERGRQRDDLRPGLRLISFKRRVTIAYHISGTRVIIDRIAYAGRNIEGFWDTN
jgi:toxin ParE1/3/4